jgi:hypothetical protein
LNHESLKTWARELVQALASAHAQKLREGIQCDDVWDRLSHEIAQARSVYFDRLGGRTSLQAARIFEAELNDALLADQSFNPCPLW